MSYCFLGIGETRWDEWSLEKAVDVTLVYKLGYSVFEKVDRDDYFTFHVKSIARTCIDVAESSEIQLFVVDGLYMLGDRILR